MGWWEKKKKKKNGKSGRGVACPIGVSADGFFSGGTLVRFGQDSAGDRTAEIDEYHGSKVWHWRDRFRAE